MVFYFMSKKIFLIFFLLLCSLFNGNWLYSQSASPHSNNFSSKTGLPIIRNYTPKEYGAHIQNWAIIKDKRGIMYFGNGSGLLEYDGVSWRLIEIPNMLVRSLAMDEEGRIYVGGSSEFGYLTPDSIGNMIYISLVKFVPEKERQFYDVWGILVCSKGIFFQTFTHLFLWNPVNHKGSLKKTSLLVPPQREMKTWKPESSFQIAFVVHDQLYICERKLGLMTLVDDSLQLVPGGERFAHDRLLVMLPYQLEELNTGRS